MVKRLTSIVLSCSILLSPLGAVAQQTNVPPAIAQRSDVLQQSTDFLEQTKDLIRTLNTASDVSSEHTPSATEQNGLESTSETTDERSQPDGQETQEEDVSAEPATNASEDEGAEGSEADRVEESVGADADKNDIPTASLLTEAEIIRVLEQLVEEARKSGGIALAVLGGEDPVLFWNDIALRAVAEDHSGTFGPADQEGPTRTSRALAIVHAAIYDAVNSIEKTHEPYLSHLPLPTFLGIPTDAAVAEAAYRTLIALYPAQASVFDAAHAEALAQIPNGPGKNLGLLVGRITAIRILAVRRDDGSDVMMMHEPSPLPGRHRKDPLNPTQPYLTPKWGSVKAFVLQHGSQFRTPPPPELTSPEYAVAYEEAKHYGGDGIHTEHARLKDQTNMGIYWAYDGTKDLGVPPRNYNQIARLIAQLRGNTPVENARLFALVNLALADAGIGAWDSKYFYDYWRPIVAIREADPGTGPTGLGDGNPLTEGDPSWTPLGAPASNESNGGINFTPPFPAYPSGHAAFAAAAMQAIARFYGTDEIPFTFMSDEMNGETTDNEGKVRPALPRSFARLSDAAKECAESRIYLGIHWKFDATEGVAMGTSIANYIVDNVLQPVGN